MLFCEFVTSKFLFGTSIPISLCFYSMGSYNNSIELVNYSIVHLETITFLVLLQMCLPSNILSFVLDVLA